MGDCMNLNGKIEERLNSVLIIDKLSNPNRFSKVLSLEIENVLKEFMLLSSRPEVDVLVKNDGKYSIEIKAQATELKRIVS